MGGDGTVSFALRCAQAQTCFRDYGRNEAALREGTFLTPRSRGSSQTTVRATQAIECSRVGPFGEILTMLKPQEPLVGASSEALFGVSTVAYCFLFEEKKSNHSQLIDTT